MKTRITDSFPLGELECQFFDICNSYENNKCSYDSSCKLRQWFRRTLEYYVSKKNLSIQIKLIGEDYEKK